MLFVRTDARTYGRTDARTHGRTDARTHERTGEWTDDVKLFVNYGNIGAPYVETVGMSIKRFICRIILRQIVDILFQGQTCGISSQFLQSPPPPTPHPYPFPISAVHYIFSGYMHLNVSLFKRPVNSLETCKITSFSVSLDRLHLEILF